MQKLTALTHYSDDRENSIDIIGEISGDISVTFKGRNNRIFVAENARITKLRLTFDCDNGTLHIGESTRKGFSMNIRIGQDSTVRIGNNVTTTTMCLVSAVEGATVTFGNDVMIASENQFRSDDAHPIFDLESQLRINPAKDITIGNHVWFGARAVALGGAVVDDGTIIGFGSLVTGKIPNNVVAVGTPARVIRRDVAWERPHLSLQKPYYKPDASTVAKSEYWAPTAVDKSTSQSRPEEFGQLHGRG